MPIKVPEASEILPGLWIGTAASCDAVRTTDLSAEAFRCMSVEDVPHTDHPGCTQYRVVGGRLPTVDQTSMDLATGWMHRNWVRMSMSPVLVHCSQGVERSPLAVVSYMMKYWGWDIDEAYVLLKIRRPVIKDRRSWLPKNGN
jgi:protein-tyrosine phosphatase